MTIPGMSAAVPQRRGDVRVVTLNLWGGYYPLRQQVIGRMRPGGERPAAWTARQAALATGLRALRPDLVAFQEALRTDELDQAVELLGPGYHVAHQGRREADGAGASVASRWPLGRVHEIDLHVTPRAQPEFPCVTLVAEVLAPEPVGPLLLADHVPHYGLDFEHERERQAAAAARAIEQLVAAAGGRPHVVLAGDFDTVPDSASVRFWRGRQSLDGISVCYRDAWEAVHPDGPGHTFTPDNPLLRNGTWPQELGRRIDYVMVRCRGHGPSLDIAACERVFDQPVDGVWATDHFGVVADLTVPPRAPAVAG